MRAAEPINGTSPAAAGACKRLCGLQACCNAPRFAFVQRIHKKPGLPKNEAGPTAAPSLLAACCLQRSLLLGGAAGPQSLSKGPRKGEPSEVALLSQ